MIRVSASITVNRLAQIGQQIARGVEGFTSETAGEIQYEARQRVHVISGRLWRSIQLRRTGSGYTVEATAPYAATEEFGNGYRPPHPYFYPAVELVRARFNAKARAWLAVTVGGGASGRITRAVSAVRVAGIVGPAA